MGGPVEKNAAHTERDQVVDALKTAFAQGRLTKEEFELRVGQALAIYTDLDALTADIPAAPSGVSVPAADAAREPARQLHNKKMIQRGTAAGTAASMALAAGLAIPHNALIGVILTVIIGVVMPVFLAGTQTLLWWVLERNSRAHAAPPDPGDQALGYLTSADTDPGGQVTDGQTTKTSRRRHSSSARGSHQLATA